MYCADIHMVKKWTKSTSAFDRTGPDVYWRSLFFFIAFEMCEISRVYELSAHRRKTVKP